MKTLEQRADEILHTNLFILAEKDRPYMDVTLYESLREAIIRSMREYGEDITNKKGA